MKKQVILIERKIAFKKLPSIIHDDDLCYLLSKDYISYLNLNEIVPDGCKVLNLAGRFNREIGRLREEYLNLFTDLNRKHDSLEWWGSHIASRNSASISLQLNITYLFCAKNIIDDNLNSQNQKRLIFIADSQALLSCIAMFCEKKNLIFFQPYKNYNKIVFYSKLFFLYIAKISYFAWSTYRNRRLAFSILKPSSFDHSVNRKTILIRSWITKCTLKEDGFYVDRNFGELPKWLQSKGFEVIILPMFFNIDKSIKEMFSLIKKQNVRFLIQDHYLKLIDYLEAIHTEWKEINISLENITLKTLDLSLLFREIQLQQGFGTLHTYLVYPLLKRLKDAGFEIDKFYYPFENNLPEKPFILGCKKYFPDSNVVAFQHTAWYENQLGMFLGENEADHHPIADKIICSGPIYLDVLKNAGFPKGRLVSGPNLRYTSIYKESSKFNKLVKKPNILLPLTFDNDLAYDLIHKVKVVSKEFPQLFVYIRRHPLLNYKELEEFLNEISFTNFEYADDGSMQDWFSNTDIILSTGGSIVIVETVAKGIPLIRIEPDNNFFLDPLAWSDYPIKPVNSPDEIINAIRLILGMKKEYKNKFQTISKDILYNYFTEINENTMKVFN